MIFLALPTGTAAAKAALKFTGIEGTSGHQADVTAAQQLLTTEASPSNYYNNPSGTISGTANPVLLAEPSNGNALIVKSLRLTTLTRANRQSFGLRCSSSETRAAPHFSRSLTMQVAPATVRRCCRMILGTRSRQGMHCAVLLPVHVSTGKLQLPATKFLRPPFRPLQVSRSRPRQ